MDGKTLIGVQFYARNRKANDTRAGPQSSTVTKSPPADQFFRKTNLPSPASVLAGRLGFPTSIMIEGGQVRGDL